MRIIKKLFLSFVIAGLGFATLVGCVSLENVFCKRALINLVHLM